jgi:hypothetical protein
MASARDLITIFVGLELVSVSHSFSPDGGATTRQRGVAQVLPDWSAGLR